MTLDEFKTAAQAAHGEIVEAAARLRAELKDVSWRTDSGVEAATLTAIGMAEAQALALAPGGSATLRVISGEKPAAWWDAQAAIPRSLIADASKNLGASLPNWRRIKDEIVRPTAQEVVADVADVTAAVSSVIPMWLKLAVGGGLALGVLILAAVYLPSPKGA